MTSHVARALFALTIVAGAVGCSTNSETASRLTPNDVEYSAYGSTHADPDDIDLGLRAAGVLEGLLPQFRDATATLAERESDGNPDAVIAEGISDVHGWDGHPYSYPRGYLALTPSTFAAHHVNGTSNSIYDVTANVAAGWTYIAAQYGVNLSTGEGLEAFSAR